MGDVCISHLQGNFIFSKITSIILSKKGDGYSNICREERVEKRECTCVHVWESE